MRRINRIGQRFGRLVVLSYSHTSPEGIAHWNAVCDCGEHRTLPTRALTSGNTRSCGCLKNELLATRSRTHGHEVGRRKSPTLNSWRSMMSRCYNPKDRFFKNYGAIGIRVHPIWHRFENFVRDLGERPANTTLGRRLDKGHYEPGNCVWMTPAQQSLEKKKKNAMQILEMSA